MEKQFKIRNISWIEITGCLFMVISLIMLINSIRLCFCSDIWYDELFTMGMVEHSYGELIGFTARDVHPPLYYCIAKFILDLCKLIIPSADSVIIVKIVSVMPYFLLFFYTLTFLRKRFGSFVSGIFMFCILAMPQMSAYTVEMRMYGWALFFVTATFFHAYDIVCGSAAADDEYDNVGNNRVGCNGIGNGIVKNYVAILIYGLAASYTQYFACVAVVMVYLYLLVGSLVQYKKPLALKGWIVCAALSILGYLPWLFVLISQITAIRDNYWILPLTWRSIGGCVKFIMKPAFQNEQINIVLAVVLFLVYVALLIAYGFSTWKTSNYKGIATFFYTAAGCLVLCGLVAFGFIASIIIRPIFVYRYMLPAMGCFWLCFALCLDHFCRHNISGKKILFYLASPHIYIIIIILAVGIRDYQAFMGEEEYKAVLMKETEQAFSEASGAGISNDDIIIYNFDQLQAVCGYYLEQENYLWNAEPEKLIVDMFGNKGSIQNTSQIKELLESDRQIWFFGSFNSREDIRLEWREDGIGTEEIGSYMLERYWFNIYRVFTVDSY